MPSNVEFRQRLMVLIAKVCGLDVSHLSGTSLVRDLGLDSISMVMLGVSVSIEFDTEIPERELMKMLQAQTISELIAEFEAAVTSSRIPAR